MNTTVKNEVMLPEFVSQLIRIAKSEGMNNDSNDIEKFGKYVAELQTQIIALEKQIEAMNKSLENLQDEKIKDAQETMINESKNKVSNLKLYGKKCSSTLKSLLMTFRLKGSNAFKTALKATKFDLLVKEGAKLYHSASETFKTSAERTKLLSKELGGVRHSAANVVAVLAGKDITEAPKHLDNDKGLLHLIEKGFTGLSQKCDKLGSRADNLSDEIGYRYMKISAEQKDILSSEGYKEFSQSDDGNYIIKYLAEEKNNIIKIVNNQNNTMKNVR